MYTVLIIASSNELIFDTIGWIFSMIFSSFVSPSIVITSDSTSQLKLLIPETCYNHIRSNPDL